MSRDEVKKALEHVKGIKEFPKPVTVKDMQEFLGMVNFQRKLHSLYGTFREGICVNIFFACSSYISLRSKNVLHPLVLCNSSSISVAAYTKNWVMIKTKPTYLV